MRDYGKVFSRIWESADFRALSEDGRTLVMYLLTCQHGTIAGVFRVPDGYACEDLQWTPARVEKGFANLSEKGFATRCEASKWVWVTKYLEWNKPENPNQRKSAAKIALGVPDQCSWKRQFMRVCGPSLELSPMPESDPSETVAKPLLNQEKEQEQEQEQKKEQEEGPGKPAAWSTRNVLAEGVDPVHLKDWVKARKSPLTETAWKGLKAEAEKAGITPAEAVRICAVKGWRGFNSTWNWRSAANDAPSVADDRDAEILRLMGQQRGEVIDA